LAEILPLESADMYFPYFGDNEWGKSAHFGKALEYNGKKDIPCWSLASLLEQLHYPQLSKDKLGSGKVGWMVSVYPNNCRYDSCWHDNPVDACVDMIEKLHELKKL
jgi:hypothetical protein